MTKKYKKVKSCINIFNKLVNEITPDDEYFPLVSLLTLWIVDEALLLHFLHFTNITSRARITPSMIKKMRPWTMFPITEPDRLETGSFGRSSVKRCDFIYA